MVIRVGTHFCVMCSWCSSLYVFCGNKKNSFHINRNEIVGFYGLVGAGETEIARALLGADEASGSIVFKGREVGDSPKDAIASGIALVPEERRTQGLFTSLTIRENIPVMNLRRLSDGGVFRTSDEQSAAVEYVQRLRIVTDSIEKHSEKLSGGNQQKVVIAKWLMTKPRIILLNDPTRGIDVGTKQEIYHLLRQLAEEGASILFYTTDYEELIGCCDRVDVMYDGAIVRELKGDDITEHNIISSALNIDDKPGEAA